MINKNILTGSSKMAYFQNLGKRMYVAHFLCNKVITNVLQNAKLIGEVDAKTTLGLFLGRSITGWVKKNVPEIHFRITKVKRKF